jgi:hypothetical protein
VFDSAGVVYVVLVEVGDEHARVDNDYAGHSSRSRARYPSG